MTKKEINIRPGMNNSNLSRTERTGFLYESAVGLMEEAKVTINNGNVPETRLLLNRARNIFMHLLTTLNVETGGDFARKLSTLYSYFIEKMTMADSTKNARELEDIIPIVNDIKEAQRHPR